MQFEERTRAELALSELARTDQSDGQERLWPRTAQRITQARIDAGLTEIEVARRLNMTIHSYWDLERHDDEAFTVASLDQLTSLGRMLSLEPRVLLLGSDAQRVTDSITFEEISARLRERIGQDAVTAEQFGDSVGWDVGPLLTDPRAVGVYGVEALYDICNALGLDWVAALPRLA